MDDKKVDDKYPMRKGFDYQERWHGFGSPVGLGVGWTLFGLGLLLIAAAIYVIVQTV